MNDPTPQEIIAVILEKSQKLGTKISIDLSTALKVCAISKEGVRCEAIAILAYGGTPMWKKI